MLNRRMVLAIIGGAAAVMAIRSVVVGLSPERPEAVLPGVAPSLRDTGSPESESLSRFMARQGERTEAGYTGSVSMAAFQRDAFQRDAFQTDDELELHGSHA